MSYFVTILRTRGGRLVPFSKDEVAQAAASRGDLHVEATRADGLELTVTGRGEASPVLTLEDGEIRTRNPDKQTLELMVELASALGARVRGDELETYRTAEESYLHPDDEPAARSVREATRSSRRRLRVQQLAIWGVFALLAAIVSVCSRR